MTTISDYLQDKTLWADIKTKGNFEWIDDTMDLAFLMKYGQRSLFSNIKSFNTKNLVDLIVNTFKAKWDKINGVELDNILAGQYTVHTTVQTTDNEYVDEGTNTSKVSAYNDEDLVTDDLSENEAQRNLHGVVVTEYKSENVDLSDLDLTINNLEALDIKIVAMTDVIDLIALDLYK